MEKIRKAERLQEMLADHEIRWQFNLAKAPWWGGGGGHYERLIGVFKSSFRKTVGKGLLSFPQLEDVVIDVEMVMNARPLMYLEDDIEQPVLTPNSFLHGGPCITADLERHQVDNRVSKQEAKRVKNAKKAMWRRLTREYLTALR